MTPTVAQLSSRFTEHATQLGEAHAELLRFGTDMNLLADWICHCNDGQCPNRATELFTVDRLISAINTNWDPDELPEDESIGPMEIRRVHRLRQGILDFGFAMNLFTCPCDDEACPKRHPHALRTRELLQMIWREWHARNGCFNQAPTESDVKYTDSTIARNFMLLDRFIETVTNREQGNWEPVLVRYMMIFDTPMLREAQSFAAQALAYWIHDDLLITQSNRARSSMLQIPERRGWDEQTTGPFVLAMNEAITAILVKDIVHDDVTLTLYEAVDATIPMNELQLGYALKKASTWNNRYR
jgi:hypothetical protein